MYALNTTRIADFEQMLRNHRFAATVKDPAEFRHALKRESTLQRIALSGDHRYVDMFHQFQQNAIRSASGDRRQQPRASAIEGQNHIRVPRDNFTIHDSGSGKNMQTSFPKTGKGLMDLAIFRTKVRNFDWEYYHYRDSDVERYQRGRSIVRELRDSAKVNEGEYLKFWLQECQKHAFNPFPEKRNA